MLKDAKLITDFIKNISVYLYDKEMFFYDTDIDKWYSRIHCKYLTFDEVLTLLEDEILELK